MCVPSLELLPQITHPYSGTGSNISPMDVGVRGNHFIQRLRNWCSLKTHCHGQAYVIENHNNRGLQYRKEGSRLSLSALEDCYLLTVHDTTLYSISERTVFDE